MPQPISIVARSLTLLLILASVVHAQQIRPFKSDLYESNADLEKVSAQLLRVRKMARDGKSAAQAQQALPAVRFAAQLPEIEVRLDRLTPDIVQRLRALGMNVTGVYYEYARVVGTCDPMLLDQIAAIPGVKTIEPNYLPQVNTGSVTSQADTVIRASQARAQFGVDGTGVPVGILSDSFDKLGGGTVSGSGCARTVTGTTSQNSGDLPPSVALLQDTDGEDEGRAMAELVHDLAPGAPLLFNTAFTGEAGFAAGINALRSCGAKVIVDDITYFQEPMFQDGIVAQAAQAAVDAGVVYLSSAANNGTFGVDDAFVDAAPFDDSNNLHVFANGFTGAAFTVPAGCSPRLVLQWADPFDGTLGPGASSDFDLILLRCNGSDCVQVPGGDGAQGCSRQDGGPGGDPFEIINLPKSATSDDYVVGVSRFCGDTSRFRLILASNGCLVPSNVQTSIFNEATIFGHPAAAGAVAVAAVDYREIAQGGTLTPPSNEINVEYFSSLGGNLPFFFGPTGAPLPGAPQLRTKPEIAAPDNTNTTFFVPGRDPDGDGLPNFNGTSAAAPHAAAVAALIRQKNPSLSPAGVLGALTSTALDIESPGFDFLSGAGLIDALDAVQAAAGSPGNAGLLENPQSSSFQSGIGVVSGWVCQAAHVTFRVDDGPLFDAAYGTPRGDTAGICGDSNNGFGALFNWSLLGDGTHTLRVFADGVQFGSAVFDVATLGTTFLRGAAGLYLLNDFPGVGESVILRWQEASQNFVIAAAGSSSAADPPATAASGVVGVLENPNDASDQSGIGVISGWVCAANQVTVRIDGGAPIPAAYGTPRGDTAAICGDSNNGFGLLLNWNLLGDGNHTLAAYADGVKFGQSTLAVTTLGTTFLRGASGQYLLPDFIGGTSVIVRWQEAQQNFVIIGTQ